MSLQSKRGLIVKKHFDSSHFLKGYNGNCANLHGHTYHVDFYLNFKSHPLDNLGMLVDFKVLDGILEEIIKPYDHQLLNGIEPYGRPRLGEPATTIQDFFEVEHNPTAEYMAEIIFRNGNVILQRKLDLAYNVIEKVVLWETDKYAASFELE